jgi:hypothetical protein
MTKRMLVAGCAAGALFLAGFALSATGGGPQKLIAKLGSRSETPVPMGATKAAGLFTATLSGRKLAWRLTFSGLTGPASAAHIHLGRAGVAGPVAVPLCTPCTSGAHGTVTIAAKVAAALTHGGAYVNVHTKRNPAGEIRGQVSPGKTLPPVSAQTSTSSGTTTGDYGY